MALDDLLRRLERESEAPAHDGFVACRKITPVSVSAQQVHHPACRTCRHIARPGLSPGYCGGRDDLPPAYTAGHPLRRLPADGGATCTTWEIQT